MDTQDPTILRISRDAYEYGFTKARMLRDLGHEPRLTQSAVWLLHEEFYARYGGDELDVAADVYWPNFAKGFLGEAASLDGPANPQERSRALYALDADVGAPEEDPLAREREELLAGPHRAWAERELEAFAMHARKVGDRPPDLGEPGLVWIGVPLPPRGPGG